MAALVQARVTEIRQGEIAATTLGKGRRIVLKNEGRLEAKVIGHGVKLTSPQTTSVRLRSHSSSYQPITIGSPVSLGTLVLCGKSEEGKWGWLPKTEFIRATDDFKLRLAQKRIKDQPTYRLIPVASDPNGRKRIGKELWMDNDPYDPQLWWLLSQGCTQRKGDKWKRKLVFQEYNPETEAWGDSLKPTFILEPAARKEG